MNEIEFILYVANQEKSRNFYQELLNVTPSLDVPGMTEFELTKNVKLGLMPENGIARILNNTTPHPKEGTGIPRCELYIKVINAQKYIEKGDELGGKIISNLEMRNWGDKVGYISDIDGHIIAFVEKGNKNL